MTVAGEQRPRPRDRDEYLGALREALAKAPRPQPEVEGLPFAGGLVGVSGYDVVRLFERLPQNTTPQTSVPDAAFAAPSSFLVFDHLTRRVALLHDGPESERQALRQEVIKCLRGPVPRRNGKVEISPVTGSLSETEYCDRVDACKEHIAAGDIYQIVLSVLFRGRSNVAPFEVYRAMRLLNPSPYMFYFQFDDLAVVGSSPEALVRLNGSRASLRPIAGTLPRGETTEQDLANEKALLADPKEAAEHVMLVDLARNDLGRVAHAPVRCTSIPTGRSSATVTSCTSSVVCKGELDRQLRPVRPVRGELSCRHAGRRTQGKGHGNHRGDGAGWPWSLRRYRRLLRRDGDMDQAITIRTLVFSGDEYSFQAGCGYRGRLGARA